MAMKAETPARSLSGADARAVERSFDRRTLAKARLYASQGAVIDVHWDPDGQWIEGSVLGSRSQPYEVTVDLQRDAGGRLESVDGDCTCPVGYDCKHAATLLLWALDLARKAGAGWPPAAQGVGTPDSPASVGGAASWDSRLGALLGADGAAAAEGPPAAGTGDHAPTIALQFELVTTGAGAARMPARPGKLVSLSTAAPPRIRFRPVVAGSSGNWVRSGISWRTVDYLGSAWFRRRIPDAHIPVLKEIRALGNLADPSSTYANDATWFDTVSSRRIWDLLCEAQDVGIPLVAAGRGGATVTVHRLGAEAVLDAATAPDGPGIVLRPRLVVGTVEVPMGANSILLGAPPHGVVWWDPATVPQAGQTPNLSFARFAAGMTASRTAFLNEEPLLVPDQDVERFLHDAYPRIRRRIRVMSSDGSVVLPDLGDEALILTLRHGADHRVDVAWSIGIPGTDVREPLADPRRHVYDGMVARAVSGALGAVVRSPLGGVLAPAGDRLEPGASLEGMSAVRFLTEVVPTLEAGGQVLVEHIGTPLEYRESAEAPAVSLSSAPGDDRDWFDLAVEVRVGDEVVPFVELFLALANGQAHMLLPSGTFFSLENDTLRELARLIAEARALHDADEGQIRVSRYQASLWEDFSRLGVVTAQASAWEQAVRALASAADRTEHPRPAGLEAQLRPYQLVGYNWLAYLYELGLGGILADDMGLGKTLEVLALVCHVHEHRLDDRPFLVVAPTSVVGNWAAECRKFAPGLRVATVQRTAARRGSDLAAVARGADVVVTSYALFRLEYEHYETVGWAGLVLDEAQFAKNVHSQAYQRAKTLPVRFKLAVTGTPMENHLLELWALASITAPGLLGSADRFTEFYRVPIERHRDEDRLNLLRRRIQPLLLRRSKEQVATDLPERREQVLELELAPSHRKIYQTYLQRERQKVLGLLDDMRRNRFEILKSLTLLRQASLDVRLVDPQRTRTPSTKLDAMMEMLEDVVADGHRVIVFSQFTRFLRLARERVEAAKLPHCYLDGRTRNRTAVLSAFRTGDVPVFLISLKAGGFGLNLTEADYCILLDPWWNPAAEAQAVDRVHRIGQTKNVLVYRLVAKDTIEEKVMAMKARKQALFTSVLDGGGFESGALTAGDIRRLLD